MTEATVEQGITALRAVLQALPRPEGWDGRRRRIEEVGAIDGLPEGVSFTPLTVAGRPAEWSEAAGVRADRAVLFLHGGGYCSGSLVSHRTMAGGIAKAAKVKVLALQYRLAPEHPYPAALEDSLSAWRFLLDQGFAPGRIALAGDSAGGGLVLAMLQRLRDAGEPLPACGWLFSPWTDLTLSGDSMAERDAVDPVCHGAYLSGLAGAYLAGHDPRDPLVSPLFGRLEGLPPLVVQVGADEVLLDDSTRLARALGAQQVMVTLQIWPRMIHAFPLWAARLEEGRQALADGAAFLDRHMG